MNPAYRRSGTAQFTLLLALGAEAALFGTLVMSYLFLRAGGSNEPFTRVGPSDLVLASLNSLVLLVSATFARNADQAIKSGRTGRLKANLLATLVLGTVFVLGQIFEFNHSGMQIEGTVFGAAFFALISFHAVHVLAGMTILGLNYLRARLGDFSSSNHVAVTIGTWFWYFVAAVWIILFSVLYLV